MRRRSVLALGALTAAALAGCGEPLRRLGELTGPATPAPAAPGATTTLGRARRNGTDTVVLGLPDEPATLAAPPTEGGSAQLLGNLLFSRLVGVDDHGAPYPDLAETVPTVENGGARWVGDADARQLEVTFKLRRGARWGDGQPVTARDVVFSWALTLNPTAEGTIAIERRYEKVQAPDDATVVLTFFSERSARAAAQRQPNRYGFLRDQRGPVVDPLYFFGLPSCWIYPAHLLGPLVDNDPGGSPRARDLLTRSDFARKPLGCGPFALGEWQAGKQIVLTARSDDVRGTPKLKRIVVAFGSVDALRQRLRDGEVDLLVGPAAALEETPGVRVDRAPSTSWEHLDLNLDGEALRERAVREALLLALDREALARVAEGYPLDGVVPRAAERWTPPDTRRAAGLLDGAGWRAGPDGTRSRGAKRLTLTLLTTDDVGRSQTAGSIAQQLGQVGFEVRVDAKPARLLFGRPDGALVRQRFDLALYAWVGSVDPLSDLTDWYASGARPTRANALGGDNFPGLQSADLDRTLAEAAATLEAAKRAQLLAQANGQVMAQIPSVPLFIYPRTIAVSAALRNVRPAALAGETWNAVQWQVS